MEALQVLLANPTLITVAGAVTTSIVAGFWAWRNARPSAEVAIQGKLYEGFQMNLKTMQDMQAAWRLERQELVDEVGKLRRGVAVLTRHISVLERTIAAKGLDVPERPEVSA